MGWLSNLDGPKGPSLGAGVPALGGPNDPPLPKARLGLIPGPASPTVLHAKQWGGGGAIDSLPLLQRMIQQ